MSLDTEGYLRNNKAKKRLHRQVMEDYLQRKLSSNELVHHINGDKTDNRIENLEIISRAKHCRLHKPKLGWRKKI